MRCLLLISLLLATGCAEKLITLGSTGAGAGLGSAVGGPGGGAIGGMLGYAGSELTLASKSSKDITAHITDEVVQQIVDGKLEEHKSGFAEFKDTIQKLLMAVGVMLLLYLGIPIFVAKYSAEKCTKTLTRVPFQTYEKPQTTSRNIPKT